MENVTVNQGPKAAKREAKEETRKAKNIKKALRNKALASRIRSENEIREAARPYTMTWGDTRISVNVYEVAKVVAITGAVVLSLVVAAYLVKTGVEWLVRYVMADGSSVDQPIDDSIASEMM